MRAALQHPTILIGLALAILLGACKPDRLPGEGTGTAFSASSTSGAELQAEAAGRDIPLAQVAGHVITLEEFDLRLASLTESATLAFERPERRPAFFETIVLQEMIARDAEAADLAGNAYERVFVEAALIRWWRQQLWPDTLIPAAYDDAEIEAMYEDHRAALSLPERRSARVITVEDEALAHQLAAEIARQAEAGAPVTVVFEWMAMAHHIGGAGDEYGYVRASARPVVGEGETDAVVEALFALEGRGSVAGPIRTGRGWELVQLLGVVDPLDPGPDAMDTWLRNERLQDDRLAIDLDALAALHAAAEVTIDDAMVRALADARRGGDPDDPQPRAYGAVGLSGLDALVFGETSLADFDATAYDTRRDLIAPAPPAAPFEGSGEGSGDAPDSESP